MLGMGRRPAVGLLCCIALSAAACSAAPDSMQAALDEAPRSTDPADYRDEVLETLDEARTRPPLDDAAPDDLDCVIDTMIDAGLDPDDLFLDTTEQEEIASRAEAHSRIIYGCIPDLHGLDSWVEFQAGAFAVGAGTEMRISIDEMRCMLDEVWESSHDPIRTLSRADDPGDVDLILAAVDRCFTQENIDLLYDGQGADRGDHDDLDALDDACKAGDDRACDLLYIVATPGGSYEATAVDCAGRGVELNGSCSPELRLDEDLTAADDDPGVVALSADCLDGDWLACDLLFQISRAGSTSEHLAYTCGNRIGLGGLPNCRTRLGG